MQRQGLRVCKNEKLPSEGAKSKRGQSGLVSGAGWLTGVELPCTGWLESVLTRIPLGPSTLETRDWFVWLIGESPFDWAVEAGGADCQSYGVAVALELGTVYQELSWEKVVR